MKLSHINIGDILIYYHPQQRRVHRVKVIKKGAGRIKVRGEHGGEVWKDPEFFLHRLNAEDTRKADELLRQPKLKLTGRAA